VIRDHFDTLKEAVLCSGAKPLNPEAAIALQDEAYCCGMAHYGKVIQRLTDPLWAEQYLGEPRRNREPAFAGQSQCPRSDEFECVSSSEKEGRRDV